MVLFAIILFFAMVVCWFFLPGSASVEEGQSADVLPLTVSSEK